MLTMNNLDPRVSIAQQLAEQGDRPVVLANVFTVAPEDIERFLSA